MLILILIFYRCCKCKPIDRTELCAVIYIYIYPVSSCNDELACGSARGDLL